MSHPTRFLVVGVLLVLLGGCSDKPPTAPAADANPPRISASGKPTRSPFPLEPIEFPAGVVCSFALAIEIVVNQDVATTFPPTPNGDVVQLVTGRVVVRYTNVSTGTSITENLSGPARFTVHADGSLTIELWGPQGFPDFINWGRIVIEVSPDGVGTLVSQNGHSEDVCAALS
jgi:hypothetical protein